MSKRKPCLAPISKPHHDLVFKITRPFRYKQHTKQGK